MDTADGIFSHRSKERMLEIMRDSRVGNFGAIAGILLILTKYLALLSLHSHWIWIALLAIPAWARWVEVFVIAAYPYARKEGMGKIWHETTSIADILLAAIAPLCLTLLISIIFKTAAIFIVIPLTVLPGIALGHYVYKILDGQTGDTYGASVEFAEACGLMLLSQINF
jgi:cobalamin 5'-phosphate synthase/cobalamin synthase